MQARARAGFDEELEFSDSSEEFTEDYGDYMPETIPQVIKQLTNQQKNDTIASTLVVRNTTRVKKLRSLGQVVSGFTVVPVLVR